MLRIRAAIPHSLLRRTSGTVATACLLSTAAGVASAAAAAAAAAAHSPQPPARRNRRNEAGTRPISRATRDALLSTTHDPALAYALSTAPVAEATAASEAAPAQQQQQQQSPAAVALSLVRSLPLLELRYTGSNDSMVMVLHLTDGDASATLAAPDAVRVLSVSRAARVQEAEQQAWRAALHKLHPTSAAPDSSVTLNDLLCAALGQSDAAATQQQLAGVRPSALRKAFQENSRLVLRPFLRSFVAYAQHCFTHEAADEAALPTWQIRTDEEVDQHASSVAAVSPPPVPSTPFNPLLQPISFATAAPFPISLAALTARMQRVPLVSQAGTADERYALLRASALQHMLNDLYPDPAGAVDATDAERRLQSRRDYATSRGWDASVAADNTAFTTRFLRPRRVRLTLRVTECVDAHEQQLFAEALRSPGEFDEASAPRFREACEARRRAAEAALGAMQSQGARNTSVSRRNAHLASSPAPFASWKVVYDALSGGAAPLTIAQARSLVYTLSRDQSVLHAAPFLDVRTACAARRELYSLFHGRVRARLLADKHAFEQASHLSVEQQVVAMRTRTLNQSFLSKFAAGAVVKPEGSSTSPASTSALPAAASNFTPHLPQLLRQLDREDVVALHDSLLSSLSRELDVPVPLLRQVLETEDGFVRAVYFSTVRNEVAAWGDALLTTQVGELSDEQLESVLEGEGEAGELEHNDEEAAQEGEEGEQEHEEDDPLSPRLPTLPPALLARVHARMVSINPSFAASEGCLHSLTPQYYMARNRQTRVVRLLKDDYDMAQRAMKEILRAGVNTEHAAAQRAAGEYAHDARSDTSNAVASSASVAAAAAAPVVPAAQFAAPTPAVATPTSSSTAAARASSLSTDSTAVAEEEQLHDSVEDADDEIVADEDAEDEMDEFAEDDADDDDPSPYPSQPPPKQRRLGHQQHRARFFANQLALVLSSCLGSFPGVPAAGVRVATEEWMKSLDTRSTPDLFVLDEVEVEVLYPDSLPSHPHGVRTPSTLMHTQPMRWMEAKTTYGAFLHYKSGAETSASSAAAAAAVKTLSLPSPTVTSLVEQSMRYEAMFGPGCVVFEKGLSDAWLRSVAPTSSEQEEDAATTTPMPNGVRFLDASSMLITAQAEEMED